MLIIKKPAPEEHWQGEYIQPSDYALLFYALVEAATESKKGELIHSLRVIWPSLVPLILWITFIS